MHNVLDDDAITVTESCRLRSDEVSEGGRVEDILQNAACVEDNFFVVPRVVGDNQGAT